MLNFSCANRYRKSYKISMKGQSKIAQSSREEGVHFDLVDELKSSREGYALIEGYRMMGVGNAL